jgi:hypothetical protein
MGVIRSVIIFLFVLTVIELAGYYIFSEKLLVSAIVQHYQPSALMAGTDQINVYSNQPMDEEQKSNYSDVYSREGVHKNNIRFYNDAGSFEEYIDLQDNYNYVLEVNFNSVPFAVVEEGENTLGNTSIWHSKYVWCLYKWVLVRKERPASPATPPQYPLEAFSI